MTFCVDKNSCFGKRIIEMHFRKLFFTLAAICIMAVSGSGAPSVRNAAFVFGWQQVGEAGEFNSANGWKLTSYQDTDLLKLSKELARYQVVIWGSLAGYQKKIPWKQVKNEWLDYLNRGGVFIILDANYDFNCNDIFGDWGSGFKLQRNEYCLMRDKSVTRYTSINTQRPELSTYPYNLSDLIRHHTDGWAHFEKLSPGWYSLSACPDGNSFLAVRRVGKGTLAALAYGGFIRHRNQIMLEALAENLLTAQTLAPLDRQVAEFTLPEKFGRGEVRVKLKKSGAVTGPSSGDLSLYLNGEKIAGKKFTGNEVLPFNANKLGDLRLELTLSDGSVIRKHGNVKAPISLALGHYVVYPMGQSKVPFLITSSTPDLLEKPYEIEVFVNDQPLTPVRKLRAGIWLADFTGKPAGEYHFTAVLRNRETGEKIFTTAPQTLTLRAQNPYCSVAPDGIIHVNNQAIFPLGLYHVSWDSKLPTAKRDETVNFAAQYGYNVVNISRKPEESDQSFIKFLALAKDRNILTIVQMYRMAELIPCYRSSSAVLAWVIYDEPEMVDMPAAVFQQYLQSVAAADTEHPAFTCFMNSNSIETYWPVPEILSVDPYPKPQLPLDQVYHSVRSIVDATSGCGTAVIAVLQSFDYPNDTTYIHPTARQIRNMTMQALVAGARGLLYYTYQDGRFYLPDFPALLTCMKELPAEIRPLTGYLLNGRRQDLAPHLGGTYAGWWKMDGPQDLVIAVNTTGKPAVFTLKLPEFYLEAQPLSGDAKGILGGKTLTVRAGPEAYLVMILKKNSPPPK